MDKQNLEDLIAAGLSQRGIAKELDVSQSTVKHWLGRYGLKTIRSHRGSTSRYRSNNVELLSCSKHGITEHVWGSEERYRCRACRVEWLSAARTKLKGDLVRALGNACYDCGYTKCLSALSFDHRDASKKQYSMSSLIAGNKRSLAFEELKKCDLVCLRCHAERECNRRRSGD